MPPPAPPMQEDKKDTLESDALLSTLTEQKLALNERSPRAPSPVVEEFVPARPEEKVIIREAVEGHELEAERGTMPPAAVSFRTILVEFLKSLASTGTFKDLHTLTCPAIILNGISLLEYCLHWAEYPRLLAEVGIGETALGTKRDPKVYLFCI